MQITINNNNMSLDERILAYLAKHPCSTAVSMMHLAITDGESEQNARVLKTIINQRLYDLLQKKKVIYCPPTANGPKPRWGLPRKENNNNDDDSDEDEDEYKKLLVVDLENFNVPHPNILRFPGKVLLFCSRDVGAAEKFPGKTIIQADWTCKGVTLYEMSIQVDRLLQEASKNKESWDVTILCRSKEAVNIVEGAKRLSHKAQLVTDPQFIPLL